MGITYEDKWKRPKTTAFKAFKNYKCFHIKTYICLPNTDTMQCGGCRLKGAHLLMFSVWRNSPAMASATKLVAQGFQVLGCFYLTTAVLPISILRAGHTFSRMVSMETCNYPRHQQFMLNNFIIDQMGMIAAAPSPAQCSVDLI